MPDIPGVPSVPLPVPNLPPKPAHLRGLRVGTDFRNSRINSRLIADTNRHETSSLPANKSKPLAINKRPPPPPPQVQPPVSGPSQQKPSQ